MQAGTPGHNIIAKAGIKAEFESANLVLSERAHGYSVERTVVDEWNVNTKILFQGIHADDDEAVCGTTSAPAVMAACT